MWENKDQNEFVALRPKVNSYLTDDSDKIKKAKNTNKYVIKRRLKLENYKRCLKATLLKN